MAETLPEHASPAGTVGAQAGPSPLAPVGAFESWLARARDRAEPDGVSAIPRVASTWDAYAAQALRARETDLASPQALRERAELYEAGLAYVRILAEVAPTLARSLGTDLAAPSASERGSRVARVEVLLLRAALLDELGELAEAAATLAEASARVEEVADPSLRLALHVARGRVLVQLGDETHATAVLHEGVALARALGAQRQEAKLLGNLGFLHGEQDGRSYEAYTRRALEIGRAIGDERLVVHSLCNLGGALAQQGRLEEARACYDEGLPRAEALGWRQSVALFQAGLGGVEAGRGHLDDGVARYGESIRHFESVGDSFQVARQHLIVGRHLVGGGRLDAAFDALTRCLSLSEGDRFRTLAWQAHDLLSTVHERRGATARALESLRCAHALREALLDARVTERVRLLELHVEAERAARAVAVERARSEALQTALEEQQRLRAEVEKLARTDWLTGLSNRRHLTEVLVRELAYIRRRSRPLALLLVDVDHFKRVNDQLGHAIGDRVLVEIAACLCAGVREHDWVGRWGGEEFCVLLTDTPEDGGRLVAERLLELVREREIDTEGGAVRVTASVGVAALRGRDEPMDDLLRRADVALYSAKRGGRDRVVVAP